MVENKTFLRSFKPNLGYHLSLTLFRVMDVCVLSFRSFRCQGHRGAQPQIFSLVEENFGGILVLDDLNPVRTRLQLGTWSDFCRVRDADFVCWGDGNEDEHAGRRGNSPRFDSLEHNQTLLHKCFPVLRGGEVAHLPFTTENAESGELAAIPPMIYFPS